MAVACLTQRDTSAVYTATQLYRHCRDSINACIHKDNNYTKTLSVRYSSCSCTFCTVGGGFVILANSHYIYKQVVDIRVFYGIHSRNIYPDFVARVPALLILYA